MRKRYSTPKRLLALLLCAVMVFSVMPQLSVSAGDSAAGITGTVADPHTLDSWKLAFDPVNITTQHAGGVWTDKSVLTSSDLSALGNVPGLSIGENNFLVALSALLTGLSVYDNIAKHAGAGTLVPITGFANSIAAPAVEFKTEGLVLGTAAKMFTIAGPVIVYGVSASVVYGLIYWITTLF